MNLCLLDFIIAFFLALFLILLVVKNAISLKLMDIPNDRSSHNSPKPRGAGIGFFLAFIVSIVIFNNSFFLSNISFFVSITIVFLVGLYDDIKGAKPKLKFLVMILAVLLLFFTSDLKIDSLGDWFGYDFELPMVVALVFTIFAIVGYTNALNLIDGLDGLAGSISLVIFLSFLYLGYEYNDDFVVIVSLYMSFSLLAFLLFNWYPAKIFMGDSGSLVLGFTISIVAIRLIDYINVTAILFLASVPILDTVVVMVRRIQRGLSPFSPDKFHIHHKLLRWKSKVDFVVILIVLMQVTFSLLGILLVQQSNIVNVIIYGVILYIFFHVFDERKIHRGRPVSTNYTKITNRLINDKYSYLIPVFVVVVLLFIKYFI